LSIAGDRARTYLLGGYLLLCYGMFAWWLLKQPHAGGQAPTGVAWWAIAGLPVLLAVVLVVQVRAHHVVTARRRDTGRDLLSPSAAT
jgi:hypothetical protein